MTRSASFILALCLGLMTTASVTAQQSRAESNAAIPHLIRFGGVMKNIDGKPALGTVRVTFAFYKEEQGGEPLWTETQRVTFDASGHYSVMLGATMSDGLPQTLFQAGDAWWIEARVAGADDDEGARTFAAASPSRSLLAAVPYALKSVDSDTLAGRAAADYVTREDLHAAVASGMQAASQATPMAGPTAVTGAGTAGYLPLWTGAATLGDSVLFQSNFKVGVGTPAPASTLDVNGNSTLRGVVTLPFATLATATAGVNSPALKFSASSYSSASAAAVAQNFVWQGISSGNNTASPSANLNLLFGSGTASATPTGLQIAHNGQITFAAGQMFPGTGKGTITGITAGTDLLGGGTSGPVTLKLDTTKVPELSAANTFTASQTVQGDVTSNGTVSGSVVNASKSFNLNGVPFVFGSYDLLNTFLGFAGNQTTTGQLNVGIGMPSLMRNTTGIDNTAIGSALGFNTSGSFNSSVGVNSLWANVTGSNNTALGYDAGPDVNHPNLSNATAIGAYAQVTASNSLVLGSIAGVNGAGADTQVGIGTTAPTAKLDVRGNAKFTGPITFASGQTFPGTVGLSANNVFSGNNVFNGVEVINNSLGIGVQSPFYPLHVNGTIRSETGGISLGGFAPLSVDSDGLYGGRFLVSSNGYVGINNPNPQAALDVAGNINTSMYITANSISVGAGGASIGGPLTINGDQPMTAAPHMYLTGFVPGPLAAYTATQAIFTIPSKNILITRLTSSGLNTCPGSGPLGFSVFTSNGGFLFTLNLSSAAQSVSDSGPVSIPIAAGTQLFGLINTPDCGSFGTAPTNIPVSIEYVMQ